MRVIDVAAALVFQDGKLLIAQRPEEGHLGGLWEFPGGKREPDETFEECLAREVREELGVWVKVEGLVESITHAYPEKTVRLNFYRCTMKQGEPKALGCPAFRWAGPQELSRHEFPAADARLLGKLLSCPELWE